MSDDNTPVIGDPLSIEARLARTEETVQDLHRMVADIWTVIDEVKPAILKVTADIREKGLAGLMGAFMGMR